MYRSLDYVIFTLCNLCPLRRVILYCNVGWCVKGSAVHRSCQQSLVAEWLAGGFRWLLMWIHRVSYRILSWGGETGW